MPTCNAAAGNYFSLSILAKSHPHFSERVIFFPFSLGIFVEADGIFLPKINEWHVLPPPPNPKGKKAEDGEHRTAYHAFHFVFGPWLS